MIPLSIISTEQESREWLEQNLNVSRETVERLASFISVLEEEAQHQNLIAPSTFANIWSRHIVDSAQLLSLARSNGHKPSDGVWLDLGTGAGFPGIVIALISEWNVMMVESRARRTEYLERVVEKFELQDNTQIKDIRLEKLDSFPAAVISARAFAPLEKLLTLASRFSTEKTLWLLPKGQNATNELDGLSRKWQHLFHVKHSITDEKARILAGYLTPS